MSESIAQHEINLRITFDLTEGEWGGVPTYLSISRSPLLMTRLPLLTTQAAKPIKYIGPLPAVSQVSNEQAEHLQWYASRQLRRHLPTLAAEAAQVALLADGNNGGTDQLASCKRVYRPSK